jgi:hypothetical protein
MASGGSGGFTIPNLPFSGAKIYATGQQTPSVNTWTPVTFDAEEYDTDGFHESVTNPTYITVPQTGHFRFFFSGTVPADNVHWACAFRVNGTGTSASPVSGPSLSRPIEHGSTTTGFGANQPWAYTELALTAGDHVQAMVYLYTSTAIGTSDLTNYPEDCSTLIVEYMG